MELKDSTTRDNVELDALDILIILAKHKRKLFGFPLVSAVVAAAISMMIPNTFMASTTLLPPQQAQSTAAAMLSQMGGIASAVAGGVGLKSQGDLYIGMIKSHTVADELIKKFDLKKRYKTDSQEKARKLLADNTDITSGKEGLIKIEVEDEDQNIVASLANAYVSEFSNLSRVLAVTEASQRRMFYEQQLERAKNNLANAEVALKQGLEAHGMVSVDAESLAIVETTSRLRAQISAKEIQLHSMDAFVTANNPDYRAVQEELASLKNELARLENDRSPSNNASGKQEGLNNIKLLRNVKYQQMLFELLAKQYELARIDEAKDPMIVQVLDPATTPERKYKPKRTIIVALAGIAGLFLAVLWSFIAEAKERSLRLASTQRQWSELRRNLRFKN
jgi:tyrosine-protein kinase Etk/Wzc